LITTFMFSQLYMIIVMNDRKVNWYCSIAFTICWFVYLIVRLLMPYINEAIFALYEVHCNFHCFISFICTTNNCSIDSLSLFFERFWYTILIASITRG
jgi:hypothetical protein